MPLPSLPDPSIISSHSRWQSSQASVAIPQQDRVSSPATKEYNPPSPIAFWMGMATWERTHPKEPRTNELHETAEAERP